MTETARYVAADGRRAPDFEPALGSLESPEFGAAIHLLKPDGMGRTFKILVQHRGLERPDLDGLKFKPFFGSALTFNEAA